MRAVKKILSVIYICCSLNVIDVPNLTWDIPNRNSGFGHPKSEFQFISQIRLGISEI